MRTLLHEYYIYASVAVTIVIVSIVSVIPIRVGQYERNYQIDLTPYGVPGSSLTDIDVYNVNKYFKEDHFISLMLEDENRMWFVDEWRELDVNIEIVKLSSQQYYIRFDVFLPEYTKGLFYKSYFYKKVHDTHAELFLTDFVNKRLPQALRSSTREINLDINTWPK